MIYAVIDTNVLVSAFISKNPFSTTRKVISMIFDGKVTPLLDDDIVSEYEEVLKRKKFNLNHNDIDILVSYIKEVGVYMNRTPFNGELPDESDRVFYEITLSVEDSFLVTGNLKHYPKNPCVVTPSEFIDIVEANSL